MDLNTTSSDVLPPVVILAGGLGTRLSEETHSIPKPMVTVGSMPILWHIMKYYYHCGFKEFVIALGYKGSAIKNFFANYALNTSDVTIDFGTSLTVYHQKRAEDWKVSLIDTGEATMTAGRVRRLEAYLPQRFCLTYGDGLSDVDLIGELHFHESHGALCTVSTVQPPGRYGALEFRNQQIVGFDEKPKGDGRVINGGFFVCEKGIIDLIDGDQSILEEDVLPQLANSGQLFGFRHDGFWQSMDTLRDKRLLEKLWSRSEAPWQIWTDS